MSPSKHALLLRDMPRSLHTVHFHSNRTAAAHLLTHKSAIGLFFLCLLWFLLMLLLLSCIKGKHGAETDLQFFCSKKISGFSSINLQRINAKGSIFCLAQSYQRSLLDTAQRSFSRPASTLWKEQMYLWEAASCYFKHFHVNSNVSVTTTIVAHKQN